MALDAEVFHGYFDGGGKQDIPVITLAGVAHSELAWGDFDIDWRRALEGHGARCFHMADLIGSPDSEALIGSMVQVMTEHQNRGLQFRAATIVVKDYERAKCEHPTLRPLEAICANFTVGGLAVPKEHEIILYFDRNEAFMHQVNRVWVHLKNKKNSPPWVRQTRNVLPVDSGYYGIQAADFIAWSLNREQTVGDYPQWALAAKFLCHGWKLYDYDAIVERYANDQWR